MSLSAFFVQLLNGLAGASSLFLVAAGLSLIFGVTRIVNFAHGSFYMLGVYAAYALVDKLGAGLGFWPALALAALAVGAFGAVVEVLLLRRIYKAPELFQLLATFALVLVIKDAALWLWGAEDLLGPRAPGLQGAVDILGRRFPTYDLLLIVVGLGWAISGLMRPAQEWISSAPTSLKSIEQRLRDVRAPLTKAREATQKLEDMGQSPATKVVVAAQPSVFDGLLAATPHALGTVAVVLLLVYFFLSSGDNFLRRLVEISPGMNEKRVVVGIARGIQQEMSRYLVMVSSINLGLAIATAIAMTLLGVPNALLWGALAGVLNFAPYVGAGITLVTLSLVGLATFPSLGHALAVPGVFFLMTVVEGQLITPLVIGRRLAINPVVVFVWLLIWGALWGVIGILLAGPLLACTEAAE